MITRLFAMICLVIVTAGGLKGQTSAERSALNNIEKQRWDKVNSNLNKAIRKDSMSVAAHYISSLFFFSPDNPAYQIDSAYAYCMEALSLFPGLEERDREKLGRIPLDSAVLVNLRIRIDSAAFGRAMQVNTEESYLYFLSMFPYAAQRERAEELRNEMAYIDALKENTYQSFYAYLTKYPSSERAVEARRRYEKLLFATLTADEKLQSYEAFVRDYPTSPYREEALDQIFEISTASGDELSFHKFLNNYPDSRKVKVAQDILYHLQLENRVDKPVLNDSIRALEAVSAGYLVPFLREDQFGLMNSEGVDVLKNLGAEIQSDYLCGNILEDIIVTKNRLLARNGATLYTGEIDEVEDLGYGFLLITSASCTTVIHKSGRKLSASCLQDARVLAGQLVAVKIEDAWTLYSLAGRILTEPDFQDVKHIGKVIALKKNDQWYLSTLASIGVLANGALLTLEQPYDSIAPWYPDRIWTRKGRDENILSQKLEPVITSSNQKIEPAFFGAVGKTPSEQTLYNHELKTVGQFKKTILYDPWVGVQINDRWQLFDVSTSKFVSRAVDSLNFVGPVAVGYLKDSMDIYFSKDYKRSFLKNEIKFIPGKDSISFVTIMKEDELLLYNSRGERLFTVGYDQIQYLGEGIFMVEKKKKKGLVFRDGKIVLPVEYDGIGGITAAKTIPVLKSMKFGVFDIRTKALIKPTYDKNITPYGFKYLVAFKDEGYGFINWENKPQSKFEFEEVRYWNDSVAWVKKDFQWRLYEMDSKMFKLDMVKDYKLIKDSPEEKIAIIHEDNAYGVISNKYGTIIPATFSDIVNIGSAEKPFYMTEKFVEEASLFVVIYYNNKGNFLRRQAYEADDYERIYCSH